jgi:hypothetical protein
MILEIWQGNILQVKAVNSTYPATSQKGETISAAQCFSQHSHEAIGLT